MKTKNIISICILLLCMILTFQVKAQQPQYATPQNLASAIMPANYTYKLFQAPNKMYGYDIFLNGKNIFHQGASSIHPNKSIAALATKAHADKAALLAIGKIKQNQPATLTQQELKKITAE